MPVRADDRLAAQPRPLVVVCAWCGRFRVGATWVAAVAASDLDRASHGICPTCFAALDVAASHARG